MKWTLLGSTALVAFAANTVAHGADLSVRPVKVLAAYPYSWTGFYAGAVAGYSWRDPSIDITGNAAATTT
jgi:outer membrane immunogenic protein